MDEQTVTVTLPDDLARRARDRVASGEYRSLSRMIRDALDLLDDRARERGRRLTRVRATIDAALQDTVTLTDAEVGRHFAAGAAFLAARGA